MNLNKDIKDFIISKVFFDEVGKLDKGLTITFFNPRYESIVYKNGKKIVDKIRSQEENYSGYQIHLNGQLVEPDTVGETTILLQILHSHLKRFFKDEGDIIFKFIVQNLNIIESFYTCSDTDSSKCLSITTQTDFFWYVKGKSRWVEFCENILSEVPIRMKLKSEEFFYKYILKENPLLEDIVKLILDNFIYFYSVEELTHFFMFVLTPYKETKFITFNEYRISFHNIDKRDTGINVHLQTIDQTNVEEHKENFIKMIDLMKERRLGLDDEPIGYEQIAISLLAPNIWGYNYVW